MDRKYRPLRPIPDNSDSAPGPSSSLAPSSGLGSKRKRVGVPVACDGCRRRKTRCDGRLPACSECEQRSVECIYESKTPKRESGSSESNTASVSRSNTESNSTGSGGEGLIEVIQLLNRIPSRETINVLKSLKDITDPSLILPNLRRRVAEPTGQPLAVRAEPDSPSLYVDIEARYPSTYPVLQPLDVSFQSSLFQKLARPSSPESLTGSLPAKPWPSPIPIPLRDQLQQLKISQWTNISIPDDLACRIITFYLETEHPALCPVDPELFIRDLILGGPSCTTLLVNALMYWACQMYMGMDSSVGSFVDAFRAEAERLWRIERMAPSVLTMAAAQFLGFGYLVQGRDHVVLTYISEATQIGTKLGLFGGTSKVKSPANERIMAYSAWATFNWIMLMGLFHRQPDMEYPATVPNLPIPRKANDGNDVQSLNTAHLNVSEYGDEAFGMFCEFWRKMHEVAIVYYNGDAAAIPDRVPLTFAEDTFQGLMELMSRLPSALTRNEDNPHHVVIFHLWLHAAILDIFRPFLEADVNAHRLKNPRDPIANADTIYSASVEQLKRLIVIYRSHYAASRYTIIWHTALLYVANAVLRDRNEGWLLYFMVCLYGYQSLRTSYPIVEPIAKGLLSMAMRSGGISGDEARQILADLRGNNPEPLPLGEIRASFMLDLDLAMSDPNAAKAHTQAEAFEDTAMMVDYTNAFVGQ